MTNFKMDAYKNGEKIKVSVQTSGTYKCPREYEPLSSLRVVGIDTESRMYKNHLTTITTQVHLQDKSELIVTDNHNYAITAVFDILFPLFAEHDKASYTKQRAKRDRHDGKGAHRDGSRKAIKPILAVFYNLEYDGPRLFGNHPQFMRVTTAELDNPRIQVGVYEVELKTCLLAGGAPNFEFNVRKDGKIIRVLGHDMWGYWKAGLDKSAKQVLPNSTGKIEIEKTDHDQTWEAFLQLPTNEQEKFYEYSRKDAELTRDLYLATVQLLLQIAPGQEGSSIVIRRDGTIPVSAPSAAARIAFAGGPEEWDLPPEWVYKMGAKTYAGARVFNRRRAFVDDIIVKDISSAYPHAMSIIPDPATCYYQLLSEQSFEIERWKGQWGVMCVSGHNYDPYYPCLRIHDLEGKRLRYVHGDFSKVWATIPEIVIGVVSGRLRIDTIHEGCHMQGSTEDSFLRKFILHVYDIKSKNEKDSPMYLMSKLLMNSLYGKLVEIQVSTRWIDERSFFQKVLKIPDIATQKRIAEVQDAYKDGEEGLDKLFSAWTSEYPTVQETISVLDVLKEKPARSGQFYLPMHGAQITGFVSAKLGLAAYCTQALQGDTDSIFFKACNIDGMEAYKDLMLIAGYDCPDEGLGSFETEISEASGYLVKTKMYALKYEKKDGSIGFKCANHGMRGVRDKKEAYALLETVMQDGTASYTKKQVRKWRTAYKKSIVTGEDVPPGEFFDQVMEIKAPNNPDQELDQWGEWVWKEF